jgi:hypothetical protein
VARGAQERFASFAPVAGAPLVGFSRPPAVARALLDMKVGLGRIVALHHRSSASYHIHYHIRCRYFWNDNATEPYMKGDTDDTIPANISIGYRGEAGPHNSTWSSDGYYYTQVGHGACVCN